MLAVMGEVGLPSEFYNSLQVGLSAGQRQRISLARAVVLEPDLLILDETLSSLDQVEQARLLDLFERLQASTTSPTSSSRTTWPWCAAPARVSP